MTGWIEWGPPVSLDLGCEGYPGFAGLFDLITGACLGPTVTLGADLAVLPFAMVVVTSFRVGRSVAGPGAGLREGGFAALMTRPTRTTRFQPGPILSCSADGSACFAFGRAGCTGHLTAFDRRPPGKCRLSLFPFRATPAVGCVVSFTAAALKPLL